MKTFEDLNVYKETRELIRDIYAITREKRLWRDRELASQIRRAGVSIIANIAEGYERGSNTEFIQYLFIAKGSCGELRAELEIAFDQGYIGSKENEELRKRCIRISSMLSAFIKSLRCSGFKGQKRF